MREAKEACALELLWPHAELDTAKRHEVMVDLYRGQEVGPKVDVWALGCILFALCFGSHPFADESSLQILNAGYAIPADSPYPLRIHKLIHALLAPDPARRPASADVLAALRKLPPTPSSRHFSNGSPPSPP